MNNFEIDNLVTNILIWKNFDFTKITDEVKQRVLDITFDCTPNWWILWISEKIEKENWYFLDEELKNNYFERIKLLNIENIYKELQKILEDLVWKWLKIEWFSIYWSFLYSLDKIPNDLDILLLVSWINWLTYDALKYSLDINSKIFNNNFKTKNNEIWLSIISIDEINDKNKSYILTDSALVDKSTTFTIWNWINSLKIPNFILNQNSQKIVNWWISTLYDNNETIKKRITEALFMREYLIKRENLNFLREFDKNYFLKNFDSKWKNELLNLSFQVLDLLKEDERKIREYQILKLNN